MRFFDKSNNSAIVNVLKQLLRRKDREKNFPLVSVLGINAKVNGWGQFSHPHPPKPLNQLLRPPES